MNSHDKKLRKLILDTERLIEDKQAFICLCLKDDSDSGNCCRSTDDSVKKSFDALLRELEFCTVESRKEEKFPFFIVPKNRSSPKLPIANDKVKTMTLLSFISLYGITKVDDVWKNVDILILDQLIDNKNLQGEKNLVEQILTLIKI